VVALVRKDMDVNKYERLSSFALAQIKVNEHFFVSFVHIFIP